MSLYGDARDRRDGLLRGRVRVLTYLSKLFYYCLSASANVACSFIQALYSSSDSTTIFICML